MTYVKKLSRFYHLIVIFINQSYLHLVSDKVSARKLTFYIIRITEVMKKALAIAITAVITGSLSCATLAGKKGYGHFNFKPL